MKKKKREHCNFRSVMKHHEKYTLYIPIKKYKDPEINNGKTKYMSKSLHTGWRLTTAASRTAEAAAVALCRPDTHASRRLPSVGLHLQKLGTSGGR